ncbi:ComEA family DNA-binding protein [Flagellimonas flava]|uniref:DNA uptake protein ComE n=1 Tax=Flagellimonas flava TaxID=570519 RepID=A0A1M5PFZ3_9FLAO|nr:helix-hairpin-helix domain-containing protein [Allomuricauda flava]SHH00670.1 DNA uptake protein ComE [Allomuricauda flava]
MKSHLRFNKQERSGIFFLVSLVVVLQGIYLLWDGNPVETSGFALNETEQTLIDSLKNAQPSEHKLTMYPFNPNYISDYKGYTLGISPEELDRLFVYRREGKFVNSKKEFQAVTKVSDSLLAAISPYFKFASKNQRYNKSYKERRKLEPTKRVKDINSATAEELKAIYGIGDKLSARIIKFRDRLGGFLVDDQVLDVYGLEPQVAQRVLDKFKVLQPPKISKININKATVDELSRLVYINHAMAREIVRLRMEKGKIESFEELFNLNEFPINKIERIKLYLSL